MVRTALVSVQCLNKPITPTSEVGQPFDRLVVVFIMQESSTTDKTSSELRLNIMLGRQQRQMEKFITTKNAKTSNFMINNPFLAVMVKDKKVGYFAQCTEKSYNSHGGCNDWDVIYYIPANDEYMWVKKNDQYVVLYNSHSIINDAKIVFSGKRDGMQDEFILVKNGSEICDFLLVNDLERDDYKFIFQSLKDGHHWDGKPSQMFLKGTEYSESGYRYLSYISDENQSRFAIHCGKDVYSLWKEGDFEGMIQLDESEHWITEYNFWEDADQKLAEEPEEAPAEEYIAKPRRVRRRRSE